MVQDDQIHMWRSLAPAMQSFAKTAVTQDDRRTQQMSPSRDLQNLGRMETGNVTEMSWLIPETRGTPKSSSTLMRFSINHPFFLGSPFMETPIWPYGSVSTKSLPAVLHYSCCQHDSKRDCHLRFHNTQQQSNSKLTPACCISRQWHFMNKNHPEPSRTIQNHPEPSFFGGSPFLQQHP